jgi:prepilin-type N-terminal cleavage/methylation domain-containing protein
MKRAFTLVEVLIVLAIIAILGALAYQIVTGKNINARHRVIVIDGCQYIETVNGGSEGEVRLIHKENCTNVIHLK